MEENIKLTAMQKLKRFYNESLRVLRITKKPDKFEFITIVKVSGLGIALIGLIGFVLTIAKQVIIG